MKDGGVATAGLALARAGNEGQRSSSWTHRNKPAPPFSEGVDLTIPARPGVFPGARFLQRGTSACLHRLEPVFSLGTGAFYATISRPNGQ